MARGSRVRQRSRSAAGRTHPLHDPHHAPRKYFARAPARRLSPRAPGRSAPAPGGDAGPDAALGGRVLLAGAAEIRAAVGGGGGADPGGPLAGCVPSPPPPPPLRPPP